MKPWIPLAVASLLALALPPASAGPVDDPAGLSASCSFEVAGAPDSNDAVLALVGEATAPGAVGTRVTCELLDSDGTSVLSLDMFLTGSAAAGAASTLFEQRPLTVCTSASAYYVDGSGAELPRACEAT